MKISTRGRYAVRALLDLALYMSDKPTMLSHIAKRQAIPERYLIQIFSSLRKAGLVHSVRGAGGGFTLARKPETITLVDILEATEGPIELVACVQPDFENCRRAGNCSARTIWKKINQEVRSVLEKLTLREMLQMEAERSVWGDWFYQI
jgi:Rrf2 family protein